MGTHGYKGHLSVAEVLAEVYQDGGRILGHAVLASRSSEWAQQIYVAHRGDRRGVCADIVLVDRDAEYTYVKVVSEGDGPWCYGCPRTILSLLDPPQNRNSEIWRRACRAHRPPRYC